MSNMILPDYNKTFSSIYMTMKEEHMVTVDMDGKVVDGQLSPSSDLQTHIEIYKSFPYVGAPSKWAAIGNNSCRLFLR